MFRNSVCATQSQSCPEGYYSGAGGAECSRCGAGHHPYPAKTGESSSYLACPAGKYQSPLHLNDRQRSDACRVCEFGKIARQWGQAACESCPAGTYGAGNGDGNADVNASDPQAQDAPQLAYECVQCAKGRYNSLQAHSICNPCKEGQQQRQLGQAHCEPCSAGKFSGQTGSQRCSVCSQGYFSGGKSSQRKSCPTGKVQLTSVTQ